MNFPQVMELWVKVDLILVGSTQNLVGIWVSY